MTEMVPGIQPDRSVGRTVPRRGLLVGGLGLTVGLMSGLTTGCDDDSRAQESPLGSPPTSGFPATVPGKEGAVTLKAPPSRIVAAGFLRDTDLAVALGAPLVGAARNSVFSSGLAPWQNAASDVQLFDTTNGLPLEKIAALRPDLIMATDDYSLTKDHASLIKIAPTLGYLTGAGSDSWQTMTLRAGKLLGKADRADELIKNTKDAIATARTKNPVLAGKTFTFGPVSGPDDIYTINSVEDASAQFLAQLGMKLSPKVTSLPSSSTPHRAQLSMERIGVLDADLLIIAFPSDAVRRKFEAQPLFGELSAVQRGSYVALDTGTAMALGFPSVLSIPYGLKATVSKLVAAATKV